MKRWGYTLFVALLVPLLIASSIPFSGVSAVSPYDDNYKTTPNVALFNDGYSAGGVTECDYQDITADYVAVMLTALSNNSQNNNNGAAGGVIASWEQAVENGRFGVSQSNGQFPDSSDYSQVTVFWTENSSLYLDWEEYSGQVIAEGDSTMRSVRLGNKNLPTGSSSDCSIYAEINVSPSMQIAISNESGTTKNLFVNTDFPNYPDGYEGELIPSNNGITIRPDFTYDVIRKGLTAKDYNYQLPEFAPDEGYTFNGYSVEWSLFKCDTVDGSLCTDPAIIDYKIQSQDQQYNYTVEEYGDYRITAQYLVQQCFRYPSYPATPDYCFYVDLETEFPDYNFSPTSVNLKIDGNSISGDTKDDECDISGYCVPQSIYEDCNTYNIQIKFWDGGPEFSIPSTDTLACFVRNFGIFLNVLFNMLFVPSPAYFDEFFANLGSTLETKLGFVYTSFEFIISWIGAIVDITPKCNIGAMDGTFWGATVYIDLCQFEQMSPTIYNLIMIPLRFLAAGVMVFIGYRRLIGIIKGLGS